MAMVRNPAYRAISERFHRDPAQVSRALACAWFKPM